MNTKDIFCANEQIITPYEGVIDDNGEFVFTCINEGCGRFIKFPADVTPDEFNKLLEAHQNANEGQISVDAQNAKLQTLISADPGPAIQADENSPQE